MSLAVLALPAPAVAGQVSGTPYTDPTCQSSGVDGEVSLAVNPRSGRMVGAWMQDLEGLGSSTLRTNEVVTSTSTDGERWTPAQAPSGVSLCEIPPGTNDVVYDPSVSVGPDGRWYLSRLGVLGTPLPLPTFGSVYVSTSTDGSHWSSLPARIPDYAGDDDFDRVVADPRTPGRAYVTASSYDLSSVLLSPPPQHNRIVISRTTDGGETFSAPSTVHASPNGRLDVLSELVVLSDGTLLDVFAETLAQIPPPSREPITLYATRSNDHGATWSTPVKIAGATFQDIVDPKDGTVFLKPCCVFSLAAGPNDGAEVAWTTAPATSSGQVHVATTVDGGRSWQQATVLDRPAQAFQASVAQYGGTLAVTFYDLSGTPLRGSALPATLWLARSSNRGATWNVTSLAGPFDMRSVVPVGGERLGDFQTLVASRTGFEAAFTLGPPLARNGSTDVFADAIL